MKQLSIYKLKRNLLLLVSVCLLLFQAPIQTKGSSDPSLSIQKELISLKVGETKTLEIEAYDSDGNEESFTVDSGNLHCTITILNTNSIRIKGDSLGNEEVKIISDSGIEKTVTIRVFDPLILDDGNGLLIAFVDQFTWKWDDKGSGADQDGRFSQPIVPSDPKFEGFHPLGSHAKTSYNDPNNNDYSIIVKDKNNAGLLAKPLDYELVWKDSGSGANADGSFWLPIAPEGYVAFGLVAQQGYNKPSTDIIRCVAKELTVSGKIGGTIWNDKGSGASADFGSFAIIEPDNIAPQDGSAFLRANTFSGAASHSSEAAHKSVANLLKIDLPIMEAYEDTVEPRLSGFHPYDAIHPVFSKSIFVPFTLIKDGSHTLSWKIQNSPFYYVSRMERFTSLDYFDNRQGSQDVTKTISFETGFEESKRDFFAAELSITVSAESGVKFLGSGGKISVSVTSTFRWETETAQSYWTTTTKSTEYIVPAGKFAEILQVTSSFLVVTGNDFTVGELPMKSSGLKILEYPLGGSDDDDTFPLYGFTVLPTLIGLMIIVVWKHKK